MTPQVQAFYKAASEGSEAEAFRALHTEVRRSLNEGLVREDIDEDLGKAADLLDAEPETRSRITVIAEVCECLHGFAYPTLPGIEW